MLFPLIVIMAPGIYLLGEDQIAPAAPLLVLGYYVTSFIGVFFSVGLAATADKLFRGEEAKVSDGIAVARRRVGPIAGWAAIAATVGLVLNAIAERGGPIGEIVSRVLDVGWTLITFLTVPVIALEGTGPIDTFKRSAGLFRERWGQQITGNVAIGGAVVLLGILPSALLIAGGIVANSASGALGIGLVALGLFGIAISILVMHALNGIFGVALYRYAVEGAAVGGFTSSELEAAVRHRAGAGAGTAAPGTI